MKIMKKNNNRFSMMYEVLEKDCAKKPTIDWFHVESTVK